MTTDELMSTSLEPIYRQMESRYFISAATADEEVLARLV
jgi:hypothetical protein